MKITSIKEVKIKDQEGYEILTEENKNIYILIDNFQCCCENWGYFASEDDFSDFIGANIINISLVDDALKVYEINTDDLDAGDIQFVNVNTDKGMLQFAVYNAHNGFYGHSILVKFGNDVLINNTL